MERGQQNQEEAKNPISQMYLVIPILALAIGNFLFYSQLKKVDKNLKLEDNFSVY
ncbi:MAG: hypothetical protein WBA61_13985 [Aequorivita sp.]